MPSNWLCPTSALGTRLTLGMSSDCAPERWVYAHWPKESCKGWCWIGRHLVLAGDGLQVQHVCFFIGGTLAITIRRT